MINSTKNDNKHQQSYGPFWKCWKYQNENKNYHASQNVKDYNRRVIPIFENAKKKYKNDTKLQ